MASGAIEAVRGHWPEYLIEAAGLALFMITAGAFGTLLEYPQSPLRGMLPDPLVRRALMGIAMGATAIGLIYSPWGRHSGAHFNPAVTWAFSRLGKVAAWDRVVYVIAQFVGGLAGVLAISAVLGNAFRRPPVEFVVTVPGSAGSLIAFLAEFAISCGLMLAVLYTSCRAFQPGIHYYVGGNTKFYGAALFRLRQEDFGEIRHHGGISPAWPIGYADFEPYYSEAEQLYHVHGEHEGSRGTRRRARGIRGRHRRGRLRRDQFGASVAALRKRQ